MDKEKADELSRAFNLYFDNFTAYFALTIAAVEAIPDQISNHIRNAFTHMARAHASDDIGVTRREVDKAIAHIERGSRDCLKICIAHQHDNVEDLLAAARFHHGFVTPTIKQARKDWITRREKIYKDETKGSDDITTDLEYLFRLSVQLEDDICEQYADINTKKKKIKRWIYRYGGISLWVVTVFCAALASYIARPYIDKAAEYLMGALPL